MATATNETSTVILLLGNLLRVDEDSLRKMILGSELSVDSLLSRAPLWISLNRIWLGRWLYFKRLLAKTICKMFKSPVPNMTTTRTTTRRRW